METTKTQFLGTHLRKENIMKKMLTLIITLYLLCMFVISIYAGELNQQSNLTIDQNISNVLINQLSSNDLIDLKNSELYETDYVLISIDNEPIIKIYNEIYWDRSNASLNEVLLYAEQATAFDYVALNQNIRLRKIISNEVVSIGYSSEKSSINYIDDIKEITSDFEIHGKRCQILNIYCFDGFSSHQGASIYFITKQGIYIKYYENKYSNGIWLKEEEYKKYSDEYYHYLISKENNFNENGEAINGGNLSFIDFLTDHTDWSSQLDNDESNKENPPNDTQNETLIEQNNGNKKQQVNGKIIAFAVICIAFGCIAVVSVGTITAIIIIKKRKR